MLGVISYCVQSPAEDVACISANCELSVRNLGRLPPAERSRCHKPVAVFRLNLQRVHDPCEPVVCKNGSTVFPVVESLTLAPSPLLTSIQYSSVVFPELKRFLNVMPALLISPLFKLTVVHEFQRTRPSTPASKADSRRVTVWPLGRKWFTSESQISKPKRSACGAVLRCDAAAICPIWVYGWQATHFDYSFANEAGSDQDPDGDGQSNLLELSFSSDPNSSSDTVFPLTYERSSFFFHFKEKNRCWGGHLLYCGGITHSRG